MTLIDAGESHENTVFFAVFPLKGCSLPARTSLLLLLMNDVSLTSHVAVRAHLLPTDHAKVTPCTVKDQNNWNDRRFVACSWVAGLQCATALAALGKASRPRITRRYKGDDVASSEEIDSDRLPSRWVLLTCTLLVPLLGVLATSGPGNILPDIDTALHAKMFGTMKIDSLAFSNVSNKLDDAAQFLSWMAALANLISLDQRGVLLFLSMPGGLQIVRLCQQSLKAGFHRARPSSVVPDFSYPSAHTARFTFCVALTLLVLLPRLKDGKAASASNPSLEQWLVVAIGAWIIMGSCRMLSDAHWFSDTLGGAALGADVAAFMELCIVTLQAWFLEKNCRAGRT